MSLVWEIWPDELLEDDATSPEIRTADGAFIVSLTSGKNRNTPIRFQLRMAAPPANPIDILCCVEFVHKNGPDFGAPFSLYAHFDARATESKFEETMPLAALIERGFVDDEDVKIAVVLHPLLLPPPSLGRIYSTPDPHELIRITLEKHDYGHVCPISASDLNWLAYRTYRIMMDQPSLLKLGTPLVVIGDLHGRFFDLLRIFTNFGFPNVTNYLFLGDLVDRGDDAIDILVLLFAFKILYPNNLFVIRGNHETDAVMGVYGFKNECRLKGVCYDSFFPVFNAMPIGALIGGKVLCVHGGLSPSLRDLSPLEEWQRPADVPTLGIVHDVLWSDPSSSVEYYGVNPRGAGYKFGQKAVEQFFRNTGIEMLVRAHECVEGGYDFPFGPNVNVVTVFSASGYALSNSAAAMFIDDGLNYTFGVFECMTPRSMAAFKETDFNQAFLKWTNG